MPTAYFFISFLHFTQNVSAVYIHYTTSILFYHPKVTCFMVPSTELVWTFRDPTRTALALNRGPNSSTRWRPLSMDHKFMARLLKTKRLCGKVKMVYWQLIQLLTSFYLQERTWVRTTTYLLLEMKLLSRKVIATIQELISFNFFYLWVFICLLSRQFLKCA